MKQTEVLQRYAKRVRLEGSIAHYRVQADSMSEILCNLEQLPYLGLRFTIEQTVLTEVLFPIPEDRDVLIAILTELEAHYRRQIDALETELSTLKNNYHER